MDKGSVLSSSISFHLTAFRDQGLYRTINFRPLPPISGLTSVGWKRREITNDVLCELQRRGTVFVVERNIAPFSGDLC